MVAGRRRASGAVPEPALLAFPMHGQHKFVREGYRTRDGHLIEWFGRLLDGVGPVDVYSRPEPFPRRGTAMVRGQHSRAVNTRDRGVTVFHPPLSRDPRRWWLQSLPAYRAVDSAIDVPAVVWNPLIVLSSAAQPVMRPERVVLADLLDDWLVHAAFASIRTHVREAYSLLFERADAVTANSEGTLALARSFGRSDAVLLPNGCDPERFSVESSARGPVTVGYVGKIGSRLDMALIEQVVHAFPSMQFIFAGPVLDRPLPRTVVRAGNVEILGDVPYVAVPQLLQRFDIGWVPHVIGAGEVGGDLIKTYEYRASGLPVLTTPVIGARERWSSGVSVLPAQAHVGWLERNAKDAVRVARQVTPVPEELTWKYKAAAVLRLTGAEARGSR